MIKVTCYGRVMTFTTRKKAIAYFTEGMAGCDPNSSEYERYDIIVTKLMMGNTKVDDQY